MKKSNVSNGITKNNFSCHINCPVLSQKNKKELPNCIATPNYFFLKNQIIYKNHTLNPTSIFVYMERVCYKMEYRLMKKKFQKVVPS